MSANPEPERSCIFVVGPAGAGKTTCAKLFAAELAYRFIDLDEAFNETIQNIQDFIDEHGYLAYCRRNTQLLADLIAGSPTKTVYAVSSGFLLYDRIDPAFEGNRDLLRRAGASILILPSRSERESREVVVERILRRRPWLDRQKESAKFESRFRAYRDAGDVSIFSTADPAGVVSSMLAEYEKFVAQTTHQGPRNGGGSSTP